MRWILAPSLLFIPDISGFTKFVNDTEVAHGRHVIAELLELIIESDQLGMTLAELEGDAVFFYRDGPIPDFKTLVGQAQRTFGAFHAHIKEYETKRICDCGACGSVHRLSLKMVAHAGPIELISVRGFQKPYGSDVIVAHRLLKNDVEDSEYLLVTESALGGAEEDLEAPAWSPIRQGALTIEDLGEVGYRYVMLGPLKEFIPEPPPPRSFPKSDRPLQRETHIDLPPAELFELVSNLDLRRRWNHDVDDLRYEPRRVNRVGTKHFCVIGGDLIEFETVTDDFGEGRRVYGEHIPDNPFVDDFACYYIVTSEGEGSRLRVEVHYRAKPFPRTVLAWLFRFRFGRLIPRIVEAIKETAEGPEAEATASRAAELIEA
jgi:hypothetical protein